MEIQRYNRLKAAIERVQSEDHFNSVEHEQARTQLKSYWPRKKELAHGSYNAQKQEI